MRVDHGCEKNAPENMATMKHIALNMIRQIQKKRQSIKGLRKLAGWNDQMLSNILSQKFRWGGPALSKGGVQGHLI